MTSSHRHSTTGKAVPAGDTDARLDALEAKVSALTLAYSTFAESVLGRLAKLEPPVIVPAPTPSLPAGAVVLKPGDDVKAACVDGATVVLRGGTYPLSFGSGYRAYPKGLTIMGYPDEAVVIDGGGQDPHFLYLDGGSVTLTGVGLRRFSPRNSGILAVKSGTLVLTDCTIAGDVASSDTTSHGVYVLGTGRAQLYDCQVVDVPGAAVQTYSTTGGTPTAFIDGGRLTARYYPILCWNGSVSAKATLDGSTLGDVRRNTGATFTDRGCTGTGPNGSVRVI